MSGPFDHTQPVAERKLNLITSGNARLYSLTVRDAATANLIEIVNDPEWIDPPVEEEGDDASRCLQLGFWLLLAAPFVSLFLLGLLFGSAN